MNLPTLNRRNPIAAVRMMLEADAVGRGIPLTGKHTVIVIQNHGDLELLKLATVGPSGRPRMIHGISAVITARFEAVYRVEPLGEISAIGLKQAYLMLMKRAIMRRHKDCDPKGGAGLFYIARRLYLYADWGTNGTTKPVIIECVPPLSDRPFHIKKKPTRRTRAA